MVQMEKLRLEDARRLLKWIGNNQSKWTDITLAVTEDNLLINKELKEVIRTLKDNGFYQLLILLVYANNHIIHRALERALQHCFVTYAQLCFWQQRVSQLSI